jgi:hypothetical protein
MAEIRPQEIFATLERHEVRYVLVGGVAAILHGAPHVTTDVDVVPEEGRDNLERLSASPESHRACLSTTPARRCPGSGSGTS